MYWDPAARGRNRGWMSALEGAVKPTLERMFRGERVRLTASESRGVATWAVKQR